jgi:hypothetical protein
LRPTERKEGREEAKRGGKEEKKVIQDRSEERPLNGTHKEGRKDVLRPTERKKERKEGRDQGRKEGRKA